MYRHALTVVLSLVVIVGVADLSWADYKQVENTDGDRAYEALLPAISILLVLLMIGTSVVFMNSGLIPPPRHL